MLLNLKFFDHLTQNEVRSIEKAKLEDKNIDDNRDRLRNERLERDRAQRIANHHIDIENEQKWLQNRLHILELDNYNLELERRAENRRVSKIEKCRKIHKSMFTSNVEAFEANLRKQGILKAKKNKSEITESEQLTADINAIDEDVLDIDNAFKGNILSFYKHLDEEVLCPKLEEIKPEVEVSMEKIKNNCMKHFNSLVLKDREERHKRIQQKEKLKVEKQVIKKEKFLSDLVDEINGFHRDCMGYIIIQSPLCTFR